MKEPVKKDRSYIIWIWSGGILGVTLSVAIFGDAAIDVGTLGLNGALCSLLCAAREAI